MISFHSLEDRIVKTFIARESRDEVDRRAPFAPPRPMRLTALGRDRAAAAEVAANPRARSAICAWPSARQPQRRVTPGRPSARSPWGADAASGGLGGTE